MKKIALFASGSGSNAQNLIEYFSENPNVCVDSLFSNNKNAYALERAKNFGLQCFVFDRHIFYNTDDILRILVSRDIDLVVLAGFLWLVPDNILKNFTVVNIHPALLPKYGGKGMYGMNVHNAVVENRDTESGITIHYVNDIYDAGRIIFQAKCSVDPADKPEDVANKVHQLEYRYFPEVVEKVLFPGS